MILKKPYGFIIKHFKYITVWLLASLVFLILFNLLLFGLMKKKKKSTAVYSFSIIYYFILFILSLMLYNQFTSIELGKISTTIVGLYKDITAFIPYGGYYLIISTLFKGIGFNIKTLKFDQSTDLQLTEEDTEEFEIAGKGDQETLKKFAVHTYRELKYYVVENKFIVSCIVVLLLLLISSNIYINIGFYNKKYAANENLALNNLIFSVKDSYITNADQGGNIIASNKYFLVVKLGIENTSYEGISIKQKDFRIDVKKERLYPTIDQGNKFLDIAKNYDGKDIPPKIIDAIDKPKYSCEKGYTIIGNRCSNKKEYVEPEIEHNYYCPDGYELKTNTCEIPKENSEYVIAYEITKEQIQKSYTMKILNRATNNIGELNPSYKMIKFKPKNLLNKEDMGKVELGKEMNLKETLLGETKITIDDIQLAPSYTYNYNYCLTSNNCETRKDVVTAKVGRLLVIIDDNISYDETVSFYKNTNHEFYKYFGAISYEYNEKEYTELLNDVTPAKLKNKKIYDISSIAKYAKNKKLVITIRNKYFSIDFD